MFLPQIARSAEEPISERRAISARTNAIRAVKTFVQTVIANAAYHSTAFGVSAQMAP